MKNPGDLFQRLFVGFDLVEKSLRPDMVVESKRSKIEPFLIFGELIGDEDILNSEVVQGPDKSASDKACSAGTSILPRINARLAYNLNSRRYGR